MVQNRKSGLRSRQVTFFEIPARPMMPTLRFGEGRAWNLFGGTIVMAHGFLKAQHFIGPARLLANITLSVIKSLIAVAHDGRTLALASDCKRGSRSDRLCQYTNELAAIDRIGWLETRKRSNVLPQSAASCAGTRDRSNRFSAPRAHPEEDRNLSIAT